MQYNVDSHVYFISYAKIPTNISAAIYSGHVGLGFVVNYKTGDIVDVSCTLLTDVAKNFLKCLIIGFNMHNEDINTLVNKIKKHFHGHSQKAICVIVKENFKKYKEWRITEDIN